MRGRNVAEPSDQTATPPTPHGSEATLPTYALRLKAEALGRVVPEPLGVKQGAGGKAPGARQVR